MRALIVATVPSFIGQFNIENIILLQELGYTVEVACNWEANGTFDDNHRKVLRDQLEAMEVEVHNVEFTRSPYSAKVYQAYKQLKDILRSKKYDVVHCHTPVAGIVSRLASRSYRKKGTKVIYTAHGFHFYKGAPKQYWMLFYPMEKICSIFTDVLITINGEDYKVAQGKMYAKKVHHVPGVGVDTTQYTGDEINNNIRKELSLQPEDKILFSMGELSERKNHKVIIEAIAQIGRQDLHYVIAGLGDNEENLKTWAREKNVNLHLIGYRDDKRELLKACDIFCFPSLQEGLPVSLMEAMASGAACIASDIRGNCDLIEHGVSGYLVKDQSVEEYVEYITSLITDIEKSNNMSAQAEVCVKKYDMQEIKKLMGHIYKV